MKGYIESRGDSWRLRADAGHDPVTGRRRQVSRTIRGGTRAEAETALAALITEVAAGHTGTRGRNVADLLERWLAHAGPDLSPATLRGYRSKIDRSIVPTIGKLPLAKLTAERLDELYRALRAGGGVDGRPLAPASIGQVHAIIHRACEQARRWGWTTANPAELASPPPVRRNDPQPPTPVELAPALDLARDLDLNLFDLVRIALLSAARRGELCALRWSDIDSGAGVVRIARNVVETGERTLVVKPPKSGRTRTVALGPGGIEILRARRVRCAEKALACGIQLGPDAYVFSDDPDGATPLRPELVTGRWRRVATKARLGGCRFHDLRHFAITYMLAGGIDAPTAAGQAGHASTHMTLDVYGHPVTEAARRAAELLERLVLPPASGHGG